MNLFSPPMITRDKGMDSGLLILFVATLSVRTKGLESLTSTDKRQMTSMAPFQLQQNKLKSVYPFTRTYFPLRYHYHPGVVTSERRRWPLKPLQAGFASTGSRRYPQHFNSGYNSEYIPYYYPHRTHYRDWSRKLAKESVLSRRLDIIRKQNALLQKRKLHQGHAGIKFFVTGIPPPGMIAGQWMNEANLRPQTGHPNLHLVGKSSLQQNIARSSAPYEKQSTSRSYDVVGKNNQEAHFSTPNIRFHQTLQQVGERKGNSSSINFNRLGIPLREKYLQNQNQASTVITKQVPAAMTKGTLTEASNPEMRSSLQTNPYLKHVPAALTTSDKSHGLIKSDNLEGATLGPNAHSLLQQNVSPKLALQPQDTSTKSRQGPSSGTVQYRPLPQSVLSKNSVSSITGVKIDLSSSNPYELGSHSESKVLGNVQNTSISTQSHPVLGLSAKLTPQFIRIQPTTSPWQRHFENGGSARGSLIPRPALVAQAHNATEILVDVNKVNLKNGNNYLSHNVMRGFQSPVTSPGMRKTQPLKRTPSNYVSVTNKPIAPRLNGTLTFASTFKNPTPGVKISPTLPNKPPYHINTALKHTLPQNIGVNNALSNRELALKNILFPPASASITPGLLTIQRIAPSAFQRNTMSQQGFRSPAPAEQERHLPSGASAFPSKKQIPQLSGNGRVNRLNLVNVPLTRQKTVSSYQQINVLRNARPSYKKSFAAQHSAVPFENSFPIVLHKISPYFKMKRNLKRIASEEAKARRRLLELQPIK